MRLTHVEVAISTIGDRVGEALRLAGELSALFDVIVIHQLPDGNDFGASKLMQAGDMASAHIHYVASRTNGVAHSRNLALDLASKDYLWLLDDDVSVDLDECKNFFSHNTSSDLDVITIAVDKGDDVPASRFTQGSYKHNRVSILSVGTIEIIVKPGKVKHAGCYFPEDMGLGTDLPVSDEPVFLARCLRQGLKVGYEPAFLVSHPHVSSGSAFIKASHCRARGLAFTRIFGPLLGLLMLIMFYIKHSPACLKQHGARQLFKAIWNSVYGMWFMKKASLQGPR